MQRLFLLVVFMTTFAFGESQNPNSLPFVKNSFYTDQGLMDPFTDAVNLYNFAQQQNVAGVESILMKYLGQTKTWQEIKEIIQNHPLLRDLINKLPPYSNTNSDRFNPLLALTTQNTTSTDPLGGFTPTIIIDALAQVITNRFQEELNIAYLKQFERAVNDSRLVKDLLPNALTVLQSNNLLDYKTLLPALRSALHQDLTQISLNLPDALTTEKELLIEALGEDGYVLLLSAFYVYNHADDTPAVLIENLANETFIGEDVNIARGLSVLEVISRNLRSSEGLTGWLSVEDLDRLKDPRVFQIFVGLLLIKEEGALQVFNFQPGNRAGRLIDFITPGSEPLKLLYDIYRKVKNIQIKVESINRLIEQDEEVSQNQIQNYLDQIIEFVNLGIRFVNTIEPGAINLSSLDQYLDVAEDIANLRLAITEEDFGKVVANTLGLLDAILPGEDEIRTIFARYGNLAISFINAEEEEAVYTALETAALPVNSYRIKQSYPFTISLNAYAGVFGAYETLRGSEFEELQRQLGDEMIEESNLTFGLTAPVGLAFSWGSNDKSDATASYTLFTSVLDVGAVVNFRIQDETSLLPDLSFQNIFAPGAYFIYGFKNSPLALSAGLQYGPELRNVSAGGADINAQAWRFGMAVLVDIPLFRIYTKAGE